jgi:MOSC domain-containing protein YiiM
MAWPDGDDGDLEGAGGGPGAGPRRPPRRRRAGHREAHGGADKALYAYAAQDLEWWAERLGRELIPGSFGENLTIRGIEVSAAVIGERWRVGETLLEVAQPRIPCFKLGIRMGSQRFPRQFAAAGRPGAYLRVLTEGGVAAGDPAEVVHRPAHGVTVADVSRIYHFDHAASARLPAVPELAESWKQWAGRMVDHETEPSGPGRRARS